MLRHRTLALSVLALTLSTGLYKLAHFTMKARIGELGGTAALGTATSTLAFASLLFSLSHLGLPDRALVQAAQGDDESPSLQALFLASAFAAALVIFPVLWLGHEDASTALLFACGALGQHLTTLAWLSLRGMGKPWLEALTFVLAALVLGGLAHAAQSAQDVAYAYAFSGLLFVCALAVVFVRHPSLRPRWPASHTWWTELQKTLPYFVVGVTSLWLGTSDVIVMRALFGNEATGILECATLLLRTALQVPWLVGTLMLAYRWSPSKRVLGWVVTACALAIGASAVALLTQSYVGAWMGIAPSTFTHALDRAALFFPLQAIAVMGLPIGMSLALRQTMQSVLAAFGVGLIAMLTLGHWLGPHGVQLGHAAGYAVLCAGLVRALLQPTSAPSR